MIVCMHTALKKPRKSLEEWVEKSLSFPAGSAPAHKARSTQQWQQKEYPRVHLCLGLALRKPWSQPTRLSALDRTGEDGMAQSTP
ncbi:unnamed protein product [Nezara viridula]|uniref:Uncharacterized protein n=1 Tax=Nezara viridula TaxID=85310 RepID=A0A9P0HEY4_NEZVI|nr:unnamed protein product [Nezara viridula]